MPEYIYDMEQQTPEWFEACLKSIGGTRVNDIMAKGKGKSPSVGRKKLLYKLAGEIRTGTRAPEKYKSSYMDRGNKYEPEARAYYELITGQEVTECALIRGDTPRRHSSPDGLVGEPGGIEIKTRIAPVYLEQIDTGYIPASDRRQCRNFLDVSGRQWIDYVLYCPEDKERPMHITRIYRDEAKIREMRTEVGRFLVELDELLERIKTV